MLPFDLVSSEVQTLKLEVLPTPSVASACSRRLLGQIGFTLVEMAIVLVIVGILFGGMVVGAASQIENRKVAETRQTLANVREALLGFAAANGRLPCPAAANATGVSVPDGGGACTNALSGFVPGMTLGVSPADGQGYVLDAWGQRVRYAVTTASANAFTTNEGLKAVWANIPAGDLMVCATATGLTNAGTANAQCPAGVRQVQDAVAVIYSTGRNGDVRTDVAAADAAGQGADERHNPNRNSAVAADRAFISHEPTASGSAAGEFDDELIWISPSILFSRMIAAGRLP